MSLDELELISAILTTRGSFIQAEIGDFFRVEPLNVTSFCVLSRLNPCILNLMFKLLGAQKFRLSTN